MDLIALFQTTQNGDRVFNSRLADVDHLKTALERSVLLDVLLVFVESRGADASQLTTRQRRLQHVRSVDRTFSSTSADKRVKLVDEKNNLTLCVLDLFQDRFEPVFELATILRPRQHRAQIERDQTFVAQSFRHIARDDSLGQALDDCSLTNTWFADQHRIVFGPA